MQILETPKVQFEFSLNCMYVRCMHEMRWGFMTLMTFIYGTCSWNWLITSWIPYCSVHVLASTLAKLYNHIIWYTASRVRTHADIHLQLYVSITCSELVSLWSWLLNRLCLIFNIMLKIWILGLNWNWIVWPLCFGGKIHQPNT